MRIQHNIPAMSAYRNYTNNQSALAKNLEKLSSGYKINRAGDDAAGLAISEKMRAQITGLEVAQKNAKDGISLVQTAEGALTEVHDMLNRMYELAEQSRNGTYDNEVDRAQMQKEIESLKTEIDRIAESANFNGIKLLDGVGGSGRLSKEAVEFSTISTTEGVTVNSVAAGKGSKGVFEIDVKEMFGTGDKITISGKGAASATGKADGQAWASDVELTFKESLVSPNGINFKGSTKEEQAQSIADALRLNGDVTAGFDVTVDGTKVTLTSKGEGSDGAALTGVTVTDKTLTVEKDTGSGKSEAGVNDTSNGKPLKGAFEGLFSQSGAASGATAGFNVEAGDRIKLTMLDSQNKEMTVYVDITDEMVSGGMNDDLVTKFAAALSEAHFEDIAGTGANEHNLQVKDLFKVTPNKDKTNADGSGAVGSIYFESVTASGVNSRGYSKITAELYHKDSKTGDTLTAAIDTGNAPALGGSAKAEKYVLKNPDSGRNIANFTAGDEFIMEGKLSSGEDYTVKLTAGTDFDIGASYEDSMKNIAAALTGYKNGVFADGKTDAKIATIDVGGRKVDANTVFGTSVATAAYDKDNTDGTKGGHEFKLQVGTGGEFTVTSTRTGAPDKVGATGGIKSITVSTKPSASIQYSPKAGENKQAAVSQLTLDDSITKQYGTAIEIGGKTYEIVADSRDVSSRNNIAVVVENLTDTSAAGVAKKLADTIIAQDPNYKIFNDESDANLADPKLTKRINTVDVEGSTITLTSTQKGSDVAAISISTPYGDKVTVASFEFDPALIEEHSKFEFNGNTYEFVKKGGIIENAGATAIEIDDFAKATTKSLGDAFANVAKKGTVTVDDKGKITLKGTEAEDGTLSKPSVKFDNNLILQIGDTADDFNQMKVTLSDCHTDAIGVGEIDISTQEGAKDAMTAIKDAINYVSDVRGTLGATQNRLDHTISNLSVMQENIQDAESSIRDVDVAKEMMEYTKNNILVQSAQAMLAQANQLPQGVLQLLQ